MSALNYINYSAQTAIIATQHKKESVIAPILKSRLNLNSFTPSDYNTDQFGTFCGKVERSLDPLSTLRLKIKTAMDLYDYKIGVGSEGSFGSHPEAFFLPWEEEWLMFIDRENKLEIVSKKVSTNTNFSSEVFDSITDIKKYAIQCGFPDHGLIIKERTGEIIAKVIYRWDDLWNAVNIGFQRSESIKIETDMRAQSNPRRMEVIAMACENLCSKILSKCPNCSMPGFDIVDVVTGLPCSLCNLPTRSIKARIKGCSICNYQTTIPLTEIKKTEDPTFCDHCNP